MRPGKVLIIALSVALFFACKKDKIKTGDNYESLVKDFKSLSAEFSSGPLWVWNTLVTKELIDEQLADFKARGLQMVIIHPRPGLITEYLSKEWFELVKYAVDKARELNMKVYLYDENSYPSGFAGGHVPYLKPETKMRVLQLVKTSKPDTLKEERVAMFVKKGENFEEVTNATEGNEYYVFQLICDDNQPWYGGFAYTDLMQKTTTEKFLELTHEQYKKYLQNEFGKTILGIFTDEPCIHHIYKHYNVSPYTPELFAKFKEKYNYDLRPNLPLLYEDVGNYKKVRRDYYYLLLNLFVENWAIPYSQWCEKHNIAMTGHYWDHEFPSPLFVPDNFALTSYSQIPGIDILMNNWGSGYRGQFGNCLIVRELNSVANQMGRERTLSETYGAAGWDLNFVDMKRIADWEYALGVNLLNQHLSFMSIVGARKRDHPQSFSYHAPYWDNYKLLCDYYTRLSAAMSKGIQQNKILVLEPTTTVWMYYRPSDQRRKKTIEVWEASKTNQIGKAFYNFIDLLEENQIEYDLGSEHVIEKHGKVEKNLFVVGKAKYELLILPEYFENMDSATYRLFEAFLKKGGKVLSTSIPTHLNGNETNVFKELAKKYSSNWKIVDKITADVIKSLIPQKLKFTFAEKPKRFFRQHKILDDCEILFLANVDDSTNVKGSVTIKGGSVEIFDCFTGEISKYPFSRNKDSIKIEFHLYPAGSMLLCIKPEKEKPVELKQTKSEIITPIDSIVIKRLSPNVLTIDYCDLYVNGKSFKNLYYYKAQKEIFVQHGLSNGNPWDNSVQFKKQLIESDTFPKNSGFSADFWFNIEKGVDLSTLKIVCEQPDLFTVSVNGTPVKAESWWLDKNFGLYNIGHLAKEGKNKITVSCKPMSIFAELEPVYVLGDFTLIPQTPGFSLAPPKPFSLKPWNQQGLPFYHHKIAYSQTFLTNDKNSRYVVKANKWNGTCIEVVVNDKVVGTMAFPPYEYDITNHITGDTTQVELRVIGSLRNLLGPHHSKSAVGQCWPRMFFDLDEGLTLAGDSYITIPYGLYDNFVLLKKQ